MSSKYPNAIKAPPKKAHLSLLPMLILGFFGGAFIALGYLLDIHVIGTMPRVRYKAMQRSEEHTL
ncbi:hypothetical protein ACT4UL_06745, partial [Bacillus sp. HC-TM]